MVSALSRDAEMAMQLARGGTEGAGFEPAEAFTSPVFKTGAINHSTTPPGVCHRPGRPLTVSFSHGAPSPFHAKEPAQPDSARIALPAEPGLDRSTFLAASPCAMGSDPDSAVDALMHRLEDGTDEQLIASAHDLGFALRSHEPGQIRHRMRLLQLALETRPSPSADHDLQQIIIELTDLPGPA